jgi:hypothetical protein
MKAERWAHEDTLRGTLLLRMATPVTLAKWTALSSRRLPAFIQRLHVLEGAWSFSQIGISIVKKLKERALSLPGKLPAPSILVRFFF